MAGGGEQEGTGQQGQHDQPGHGTEQRGRRLGHGIRILYRQGETGARNFHVTADAGLCNTVAQAH